MTDTHWHPTEALAIRVSPHSWHLDPDFLALVEAHWSQVLQKRPHFFRGPVLALEETVVSGNGETRLETRFTDFAHFLYSRQHLDPGHPYHVRVVTACAWVVTRDRLALVGITHPQSSKPHVVQPIGGSSSPEDVRSGYFDPVAAARRELREETGLEPVGGEVRGLTRLDNGSIAIAVRFDLPFVWNEVCETIRQHLHLSQEPELAAVHPLKPGTRVHAIRGAAVLRTVQDFLLAPELC
jgi:8-oxo-dGTP pyrophosphatase MutT (NUDIX family)